MNVEVCWRKLFWRIGGRLTAPTSTAPRSERGLRTAKTPTVDAGASAELVAFVSSASGSMIVLAPRLRTLTVTVTGPPHDAAVEA